MLNNMLINILAYSVCKWTYQKLLATPSWVVLHPHSGWPPQRRASAIQKS